MNRNNQEQRSQTKGTELTYLKQTPCHHLPSKEINAKKTFVVSSDMTRKLSEKKNEKKKKTLTITRNTVKFPL